MAFDAGKQLSRPDAFRPLSTPARAPVLPSGTRDRAFQVLQPSRAPAQLSLFPPPGQAPSRGR
jgi:hypothetical protein